MEAVENTYEFLGEIAGVNYKYWVLRLDNQLLIHISQSNENPLDDLSVAMPGGQIATTIIGKCLIAQIPKSDSCDTPSLPGDDMDNTASERLAKKLAKKLNKQIFVSLNVMDDRLIVPALEKKLVQEIETHPEVFRDNSFNIC